MTILELCAWLESTAVGTAVRESSLFPVIESAHVIAVTFVVGSVWIVDLRLLGLASRKLRVTRLAEEILPWTWGAFALAVITGGLLFSSRAATHYYENVPFRLKMLLLVLAGLNMVLFHTTTYRRVAQWETGTLPFSAKIAGGLSIIFWVGIVASGRWIGFID
jgi:uncharacterized membrane protein